MHQIISFKLFYNYDLSMIKIANEGKVAQNK